MYFENAVFRYIILLMKDDQKKLLHVLTIFTTLTNLDTFSV
jgi:hypothetical protein